MLPKLEEWAGDEQIDEVLRETASWAKKRLLVVCAERLRNPGYACEELDSTPTADRSEKLARS